MTRHEGKKNSQCSSTCSTHCFPKKRQEIASRWIKILRFWCHFSSWRRLLGHPFIERSLGVWKALKKKKKAGCAEPRLAKSRDHSGMSSWKKMEFGIISDLRLNVHPRLRRTKKLPWH